jgi:hypothetical protein
VDELYDRTFASLCGSRALETYLDTTRQGWPDLVALVAGHQEGRRCLRELAARVHAALRTSPPPRPDDAF